jgi:hypothetical protein
MSVILVTGTYLRGKLKKIACTWWGIIEICQSKIIISDRPP